MLWAAENGITSGTDATHFSPNLGCTRAQVVTFLWRTAGCPNAASGSSFNDVEKNSYYEKAVSWAVAKGITKGTSSTSFSPNAVCTRGQIVTFLYRAYATEPPSSTVNPFSDVNASEYFYEPILWAVSNGITNGTSKTTFSPNANCTRAQIVTFLYRCAD